MAFTGLYFYKLISPYIEDITKNCNLGINDIDHNFITLKDADVKDASFDSSTKKLTIYKNDSDRDSGSTITVDMTSLSTDFDIIYDSIEGTLNIKYDGVDHIVDQLVTKDNLSRYSDVTVDDTLTGAGNYGNPLGVDPMLKTGVYRPANVYIDLTVSGNTMPEGVKKGYRVVTFEKISEFGLLYDYFATKLIDKDLCHGWRVPTKADWDNMLNAIEPPCKAYRNHDLMISNRTLGKFAGKLLKSNTVWKNTRNNEDVDLDNPEVSSAVNTEQFSHCLVPNKPFITPVGVDAFNMRVLPAGEAEDTGTLLNFGVEAEYWTNTTIPEGDIYAKRFLNNKSGVMQMLEAPTNKLSIRLVKDYNGHNFNELEEINGLTYECALMPSLHAKRGKAIWTKLNVGFTNIEYRGVPVNSDSSTTFTESYYMNEWNGFRWEKKQIKEGEGFVLLTPMDEQTDKNTLYIIVDGVPKSVVSETIDNVLEIIQPQLDNLSGEVRYISGCVDYVSGVTDVISGKLDSEIERSVAADEALSAQTQFISGAVDFISGAVDFVSGAVDYVSGVTDVISGKLDSEIERSVAADEALSAQTQFISGAVDFISGAVDYVSGVTDAISGKLDSEIERAKDAEEALSADTAMTWNNLVDLSGKTVNGHSISGNPIISGSEIPLSVDYHIATVSADLQSSDTVDVAIGKLDFRIDSNNDILVAISAKLDTTIEGAGLNEDGTYTPVSDLRYIDGATSLYDADSKLDQALSALSDSLDENVERLDDYDSYLKARSVSTASTSGYNLSAGTLTLTVDNDYTYSKYNPQPTPENIVITLNSNYGVLPVPTGTTLPTI
jgi:uncharacterized protein (TIGR02145 family)